MGHPVNFPSGQGTALTTYLASNGQGAGGQGRPRVPPATVTHAESQAFLPLGGT